jgi:hypothetical protein
VVSEGKGDIPRSLMFITPAALELTLRCLAPSLGGLDERPWTAESTLVRGEGAASADMMACLGVLGMGDSEYQGIVLRARRKMELKVI